MHDPKLSRIRARRLVGDESLRERVERESLTNKFKRLAARAKHDGYRRYRADAFPSGANLSDLAKQDDYSRYDTGEPHPLDGDGAILVAYIDPKTQWQMYRYDKDVVQPENGKQAYYDPEAAAAQRA
eukprot:5600779-Pleurochrysis_carterae.AAC.1